MQWGGKRNANVTVVSLYCTCNRIIYFEKGSGRVSVAGKKDIIKFSVILKWDKHNKTLQL